MDLPLRRRTPTYAGVITETTCINYPFLVTITDETGHLFSTFPLHTRQEAEARLDEVLAKLRAMADEADRLAPPPLHFPWSQG
jgi:hypothetical protein